MAKTKKLPPVKCPYCGKTFSRELEDYVQINAKRYAHKECFDRHNAELTQEEKDKLGLENLIKSLFNYVSIPERVKKQIQDYHDNRKYTYSGITKSLIWFYQIKGNPIEKANGGIGIVPYIYEDARNYYTAIWVAQQQNQAKPIEQWEPEVVEIHIPPPKSKPMKRKNLFSFLDDDKEDDE